MRKKTEIIEMINYLELLRNNAVNNEIEFLALAIASQIHLLKWVIE